MEKEPKLKPAGTYRVAIAQSLLDQHTRRVIELINDKESRKSYLMRQELNADDEKTARVIKNIQQEIDLLIDYANAIDDLHMAYIEDLNAVVAQLVGEREKKDFIFHAYADMIRQDKETIETLTSVLNNQTEKPGLEWLA